MLRDTIPITGTTGWRPGPHAIVILFASDAARDRSAAKARAFVSDACNELRACCRHWTSNPFRRLSTRTTTSATRQAVAAGSKDLSGQTGRVRPWLSGRGWQTAHLPRPRCCRAAGAISPTVASRNTWVPSAIFSRRTAALRKSRRGWSRQELMGRAGEAALPRSGAGKDDPGAAVHIKAMRSSYKNADPKGYACPWARIQHEPARHRAHMNRRRMIRRGTTYGRPLPQVSPTTASTAVSRHFSCASRSPV